MKFTNSDAANHNVRAVSLEERNTFNIYTGVGGDVAAVDGVPGTAAAITLDFDDAYQYTVAKHLDAVIVSFDGDFDRTERGHKTPAAILAERDAEGNSA